MEAEAKAVALPFEAVVAGPPGDWELLGFDGSWGREYFVQKRPVGPEGLLIEQRRGRCASSVKPFWVLRNRRTERGVALALAYMGNWSFAARPASDGLWVRVDSCPSGLRPFLEVKGMPIPGVLVAEFEGAWDAGARRIVHFAQRRLLRDIGPDWPLVQYNTWYAHHDGIDEAKLLDSIERAAELGCELFVVDAGWYGGASQASDWNEGLGDWTVNRVRLPRGIEPIEKLVHSNGMKFGMWIEIECAHPSSPVARSHPDWFLAGPGGERIGKRDVLDFGRSDVLEWAMARLTELIETQRLDYIKMDMNVDPAVDDSGLDPSPLARHYQGLAELWSWMRGRWPGLVVENCSSGSLRQDYTAVALTDTHWVSDGVEHRFAVPYMMGATVFMPPSVCSHWTVDPTDGDPAMSFEAQFLANMMGHFGLSGRLAAMTQEQAAAAQSFIRLYKQIRPLLRRAEVFHLTEPWEDGPQAALYRDAATGKELLFAFQCGSDCLDALFALPQAPKPLERRMVCLAGAEPKISSVAANESALAVPFRFKGDAALWLLEPSSE